MKNYDLAPTLSCHVINETANNDKMERDYVNQGLCKPKVMQSSGTKKLIFKMGTKS